LRPEAARVRTYALTEKWADLVEMALNNATRNTS
jgi:hypothetical protein